jgi:hypothetical protein|tara:strand:+ start:1063 stop:1227 length:165 start_codon:yes stop_codon:yes gene_type:complete
MKYTIYFNNYDKDDCLYFKTYQEALKKWEYLEETGIMDNITMTKKVNNGEVYIK